MPGEKLQPIDGVCKQYTHKYSTYRAAQDDHSNTRGSSRFACILAPCKTVVIHVSCHTCPCLLPRLHFHLPVLSFHRLHRHPQYIWYTMNIRDPMNDHTATISDRVAVSRRQSLPQLWAHSRVSRVQKPKQADVMARGFFVRSDKNQQPNKRSKTYGKTGKKLHCHGTKRRGGGLCIPGYWFSVAKFSQVDTEERQKIFKIRPASAAHTSR